MLLTLCLLIWNVQESQELLIRKKDWTNECRNILLNDSAGKGPASQRYLECMYWAYGFTEKEAQDFAEKEMEGRG